MGSGAVVTLAKKSPRARGLRYLPGPPYAGFRGAPAFYLRGAFRRCHCRVMLCLCRSLPAFRVPILRPAS